MKIIKTIVALLVYFWALLLVVLTLFKQEIGVPILFVSIIIMLLAMSVYIVYEALSEIWRNK